MSCGLNPAIVIVAGFWVGCEQRGRFLRVFEWGCWGLLIVLSGCVVQGRVADCEPVVALGNFNELLGAVSRGHLLDHTELLISFYFVVLVPCLFSWFFFGCVGVMNICRCVCVCVEYSKASTPGCNAQ